MLLGFTEFSESCIKVVPVYTGFYCVLLSFTVFYWVLASFSEFFFPQSWFHGQSGGWWAGTAVVPSFTGFLWEIWMKGRRPLHRWPLKRRRLFRRSNDVVGVVLFIYFCWFIFFRPLLVSFGVPLGREAAPTFVRRTPEKGAKEIAFIFIFHFLLST